MSKNNLLQGLYSLLWYLALPLVALRLLLRSRKAPAYRQRWLERLGWFTGPKQTGGIWVHAVSMGEVIAARPLVEHMLTACPDLPMTITTMTPTGSAQVKKLFGDKVFHVYLPYDFPLACKRFICQIAPCVGIIMETELWLNLFKHCQARNIPVLVVNARLSARSAAKYLRFPTFSSHLVQAIEKVAAQTQQDAERFIQLGLPENKISITGSIKFDMSVDKQLPVQGQALRASWGAWRPVWVAASTHEGEDELIISAFRDIKKTLPDLVLILVPRHPERFAYVAQYCQQQGFRCGLRSSQKNNVTDKNLVDIDIFIGDTMGEMLLFYACSDVAFVAGSLREVGGHNVLEPAALGVPIVVGPYMFNFTAITELLKSAGALIQVESADTIAQETLKILQDTRLREYMGAQGLSVVKQNRGALSKVWSLVQTYLPHSS